MIVYCMEDTWIFLLLLNHLILFLFSFAFLQKAIMETIIFEKEINLMHIKRVDRFYFFVSSSLISLYLPQTNICTFIYLFLILLFVITITSSQKEILLKPLF